VKGVAGVARSEIMVATYSILCLNERVIDSNDVDCAMFDSVDRRQRG